MAHPHFRSRRARRNHRRGDRVRPVRRRGARAGAAHGRPRRVESVAWIARRARGDAALLRARHYRAAGAIVVAAASDTSRELGVRRARARECEVAAAARWLCARRILHRLTDGAPGWNALAEHRARHSWFLGWSGDPTHLVPAPGSAL